MTIGGLATKGAGLLKTGSAVRIHPSDVQTAALWGVAAGATAIWIVQPFDWIKKTFIDKAETEEK